MSHEPLYERFVDGVVDADARNTGWAIPLDPDTTLGPVVRTPQPPTPFAPRSPRRCAARRAAADRRGAFAADRPGTPYLAPQVLVDVDHSMRVMREETFGPVVGIMQVASDEEALRLMNDSEFGLTAAIFSATRRAPRRSATQLETGTVFLNRCDYLDPALAWTGVKNSGRGCTLSRVGYEQLTRPSPITSRSRL